MAAKLLTPHCFLAKLDLKDAYYLVAIRPCSRKYLRFYFREKLYEFTCLPFGLCTAPLIFTKMLKPVLANLRGAGWQSIVYLDDFLLFGQSYEQCIFNVSATSTLLRDLGFLFSPKKCTFPPVTRCTFLGFEFDSIKMTMSLPNEKREKLRRLVFQMSQKSTCSIRDFAKFLGSLTAASPALRYAWVYTKQLESDKIWALRANAGNFDSVITLRNRVEVYDWWRRALKTGSMPLSPPPFKLEIFSDASLTGWGACCGTLTARGHWTLEERALHINALELLAALFSLRSFTRDLSNASILLRVDNTTAIAYINRMGGTHSSRLNGITRKIWQYCEMSQLWIVASYIRSEDNVVADAESRVLDPEIEYELSPVEFTRLVNQFGEPSIDLFASRLNAKCKIFCSWKRDPQATFVDAFTVPWNKKFFYAFPPFSIILRVLQKIIHDRAEGIVVVPNWPSQPWFPRFHALLISQPLILLPNKSLLQSVNREPHPLYKKLSLVAGILSGKRLAHEE